MQPATDPVLDLSQPLAEAARARFAALQDRFRATFPALLADPDAPRTVVIVPSLSLDADVMEKVSGVHHYEERMLCLLLLLQLPRTRVIYLSSTPISQAIVAYYLHLLPGMTPAHARRRLALLSCDDASPTALSRKLLARPDLLARIREMIPDRAGAHITCFTVSDTERRLALALDLPIYGCDPDLGYWGSKSGSRQVFRAAGLAMPAGVENLRDMKDVAGALAALRRADPGLARAVVKLNDGFSGEGNALFRFAGAPEGPALDRWVAERLNRLAFEARGMTSDLYAAKFAAMGGIVEAFIEGAAKRSPSAQMRIDAAGQPEPISTHDQVLGGPSGQIFMGARFPADTAYRLDIQRAGMETARLLAGKGALGRFGVDFLSVREGGGWRHFAIEINLRKGGTTHPFLMLQFLTDGHYQPETGEFLTRSGQARCYYATDTLESPRYRGLTPEELIEFSAMHRLHYHAGRQEGVAFHLMGALTEHGKVGLVAIGADQQAADDFYKRTIAALDWETGN